MQSIIVVLILVACLAFTLRRLYRQFRNSRHGDVRCAGCPLADNCTSTHCETHTSSCGCGCG